MNLIHAIVLGLIEGVTEFLPVSSTAHLIIASRFFHIPSTDFHKFFEVFIQSGAILAVVFIYIKYLWKFPKLIKNIIISFLPTALAGFLLHKIIKNYFFNSLQLIGVMLFGIGVLFIVFELLIQNKKLIINRSINQVTVLQAVIIGIVQSLAVMPGVSRAGAVMLAMMGLGYKREDSAVYSFLLAVPTIFAAGVFDLYQSKEILLANPDNIWILIFGFLISFISAYFSVKWLISFLQKRSLVFFGLYRIILGILVIVLE